MFDKANYAGEQTKQAVTSRPGQLTPVEPSVFMSINHLDSILNGLTETQVRLATINERMFGPRPQEASPHDAPFPEGGPFQLRLERKCNEIQMMSARIYNEVMFYESRSSN